MRQLLLTFLILASLQLSAQTIINRYTPQTGSIELADGIEIPKVSSGYTLYLPDGGKPDGMLVFLHARSDTAHTDSLIDMALGHNLAALFATTEHRFEWLFTDDKLLELEGYLHEVITEHSIPASNMLYCGMSLGGTRVIRFAQWSKTERSKHNYSPRAIAVCDAPLDMVRFYAETQRAIATNYAPVAVNEATWVASVLRQNLGGTPTESMKAYAEYSTYCYTSPDTAKLIALKGIAIRAYTEPDINWWIENRRTDYYGMNSTDLAALINDLKIQGHEVAELMITHDKGYYDDGRRHPHNWSIVDEREMLDWFVGLPRN